MQESGLVELVNSFGEVLFNIGFFAANEESDVEDVKRAIDEYKTVKMNYKGDSSIYDKEINNTLETFPDLDFIQRV